MWKLITDSLSIIIGTFLIEFVIWCVAAIIAEIIETDEREDRRDQEWHGDFVAFMKKEGLWH